MVPYLRCWVAGLLDCNRCFANGKSSTECCTYPQIDCAPSSGVVVLLARGGNGGPKTNSTWAHLPCLPHEAFPLQKAFSPGAQVCFCQVYCLAVVGGPVGAPMLASEARSGLEDRGPHSNGAVVTNGFVKDDLLDAAVTGAVGDCTPVLLCQVEGLVKVLSRLP